jgi:anti-sigma factor ChrR (cupin superfamily)
MSTTHVSREQLVQYRNRALLPQELVAVDGHLGRCQECRTELAGLAAPPASAIAAVQDIRFEHISYEQMDAWVEDTLDQTERELVLSHIGLCAPCARQLKAYESYAPVMAAPIAPAAIQVAQPITFGDKIRAMFRMPQIAMLAAAVALVAIVSPLMMEKSSSLDTAQLNSLPEAVRTSAKEVVNGDQKQRPVALDGLAPNTDSSLLYPVSEVVEERQPILRWKSFGSAYTVALFDTDGNRMARSGSISDTHWLVPVTLKRGAEYRWQIDGDGQTRTATFRVLNEADEQKLSEVRETRPGSLALGAVAQHMGLLSIAQQQFETLKREQPNSQDAAKLLEQVNEMSGR